MSFPIILLREKLRQYVNQLRTFTKEANNCLSTNKIPQSSLCLRLSDFLTELSIILAKLLSRISEINQKIERISLPENVTPEHLFNDIGLDSANDAEIRAVIVLAKIEARLDLLRSSNDGEMVRVFPRADTEFKMKEPVRPIPIEQVTNDGEKVKFKYSSIEKYSLLSTYFAQVAETSSCKRIDLFKPKITESGKPRPFLLKRFFGSRDKFTMFWKEFHETVEKSSLKVEHKFLALRTLVRGEPYSLFLNLGWKSEQDYRTALKRLFDKYASKEMKQRSVCESAISTEVESLEITAKTSPSNDDSTEDWSDVNFVKNYCWAVPKYEKPDRNLLIRAMHALLNLYVRGQAGSDELSSNLEYIWLILLHGVKFDDRYMVDCWDKWEILGNGEEKERPFPSVDSGPRDRLRRYVSSFLQMRENTASSKSKSRAWKFSHGNFTSDFCSEDVKKWYNSSWESVQAPVNGEEFQSFVRYFALLSMVLFRATVKPIESVELYVATSFHKISRGFSNATYYLPKAPPPHSGIYHLIREDVFKRNSSNFKTYMTYLVACYTFCHTDTGRKVRHFLRAGCLLSFSCAGVNTLNWLLMTAKRTSRINVNLQELLKFFTIDPSLASKVEKLEKFAKMYENQISWRWARLLDKNALRELSTADCPRFAFVCFMISGGHVGEALIRAAKGFPQFSKFMKNETPPSLTGENIGAVLRNMIDDLICHPIFVA